MTFILESKLPPGGYFSRSNLKCSCWDGGIKVRASSLIWFFKLLQRESRVKEAYGGAWVTESSSSSFFFLERSETTRMFNVWFRNPNTEHSKSAKIIHCIHSNIHSERSGIHNSVRQSWFSRHMCVLSHFGATNFARVWCWRAAGAEARLFLIVQKWWRRRLVVSNKVPQELGDKSSGLTDSAAQFLSLLA